MALGWSGGSEVEVTEAETGLPDTTEAALDMSKVRLEAIKAKAPTHPADADGAAEQPEKAQAAEGSEAEVTKGAPAQSTAKNTEYSFVADPALRAALEATNLPEDARRSLKKWGADYTQKSQQAAKVADYEQKARALEALSELPGFEEAVGNLIAKSKQGGAEVEPEPDLTKADNATILRFIRDEARRQAEAMVQERVVRPVTANQQILAKAAGMYGEWQEHLDEAAFKEAWNEAVDTHRGDITPDNVERLFKPFLKAASAARELEAIRGQKSKSAEAAARAISPAGGSSSATASSRQQAPSKDGKAETARMRTKKMLEERFGWSESDLDAAAKQ